MHSGDGAGRPVLRLLAAVLLAVLGITGVHGAGSSAVPAGAIVTEHASVGAALLPLTPTVGRDQEQAASPTGQGEEPRPTLELPAAVVVPVAHPLPPDVATVPTADRQRVPAPGRGTTHQGRAPPA